MKFSRLQKIGLRIKTLFAAVFVGLRHAFKTFFRFNILIGKIRISSKPVVIVVLIALLILELIPKTSQAAFSFQANYDSGSLNASYSLGDSTAYTDGTLPDLVDGGFGGSGQAIQASRGDTLKYATANNFDNNKVEYSMKLKNEYNLTGTDQGDKIIERTILKSIDYDADNQIFYILDVDNKKVIQTNWDGTVWNTYDGAFTAPRKLKYDPASGYLFITDGNSVVRTKMDGSGYIRLGGFSTPVGIDYDPSSEFLYVINDGTDSIIKTKIDGSGWTSFGSKGSGVNQFNFGAYGVVDFDQTSSDLYVADYTNNRIIKTKFDGSGWTTLTAASPASIQYDPSTKFVYAKLGYNSRSYLRTKMDGSNQVPLTAPGGNYNFDFRFIDGYYYVTTGPFNFSWEMANNPSVGLYRIREGETTGEWASVFKESMYSQLYMPVSVWHTSDGKLITGRNTFGISISNEDGSDFKVFGNSGFLNLNTNGTGTNRPPAGKVVYDEASDYLYIADKVNGRILKVKPDGSGLTSLTGFSQPGGIYYDAASDYIYVADTSYNRIVKTKIDGTGRVNFGSVGSGVNQFSAPGGIWYDAASDYIYVGDATNNRVVKTKIDGTGWTTLGGFLYPNGLQYDAVSDNIYVADRNNNRIVKTKIDGTGWTNLTGFSVPHDLFYDSSTDYLYVADTVNHRVVKTKIDGTGWTNLTLDPRRVLMKTQGDEMRLELDLYSQRLKFWMKKTTGGIYLQSAPLSWGVNDWHKVAAYFNAANGQVQLKIDDVVVDEVIDMTWTTSPPSFGDYVYVSSDPSNADTVNVSPIDDFKVDKQTVDLTAPTNPTARVYNSVAKTTEFTNDSWGNAATPYLTWNGATDNEGGSGIKGYYLYFGTTSDAEPNTSSGLLTPSDGSKLFQTHSGAEDAEQHVSVPASSLTTGVTYYFRARTQDNDLNSSDAATLFTYKYDGDNPDPPEFINISPAGCSTTSSFTLSWDAVTKANSGISGYQYKNGSSGTITDAGNDTSLSLNSYQEGDNVAYIRSKDNAGNISSWQTAVYCSVEVSQIINGPTVSTGPSSIVVSWISSKPTNGFVKVYSGNTYVSEQGENSTGNSHDVTVVGLKSETPYRYQLTWMDASGNAGFTDWYNITTAATPQVTNLIASPLSPTSVNVSWSTNYPASAEMEYGVGNYNTIVKMDGSGSSFAKELTGLSGGVTYQLRIKADAFDSTEFSGGITFETPPLPAISGLRFESTSSSSTNVSWTTNIPTTTTVYYGPHGGLMFQMNDSGKNTSHQMTLSNLTDSTQYDVYAEGIDQFGNTAKSDVNSFTTSIDTTPPTISDLTIQTSNVGLDNQDKAQIAVSWKTNKPATSQVQYGEGLSGENYTGQSADDKTLNDTHLVIINGLTPTQAYHLIAVSADKNGNVAKSSDQPAIPGQVPQSVLQTILQTLGNIFGWLKI